MSSILVIRAIDRSLTPVTHCTGGTSCGRAVQCSAVQCSAVQCSAVQYYFVQCSNYPPIMSWALPCPTHSRPDSPSKQFYPSTDLDLMASARLANPDSSIWGFWAAQTSEKGHGQGQAPAVTCCNVMTGNTRFTLCRPGRCREGVARYWGPCTTAEISLYQSSAFLVS